MDLVSHAVFGSAWALAPAARPRLRTAALTAALGALAPDIDVLIRSHSDPLLALEAHRQVTHALAFAPLGALPCAALAYPWARRVLGFAPTYLASLAGYASHLALDACTAWGMPLFWPFTDARVALGIVATLDPLFTVPAVGLVLAAIMRRNAALARIALVWTCAYLAACAVQSVRASHAGWELARGRGHAPIRLEVKPALFASALLWKVIYEHDGRFYVDAVRTGVRPTAWTGASIPKLDVAAQFPWLSPQSQQARDIERFARIADGLVAPDPTVPNRVVDLRYSLVPGEIAGFWAVVLDPAAAPDDHVGYVTTRENAPDEARRLLGLLFEPPSAR